MTMKGFWTSQGYMGYVLGKGYMLFVSPKEYWDYVAENFSITYETEPSAN